MQIGSDLLSKSVTEESKAAERSWLPMFKNAESKSVAFSALKTFAFLFIPKNVCLSVPTLFPFESSISNPVLPSFSPKSFCSASKNPLFSPKMTPIKKGSKSFSS